MIALGGPAEDPVVLRRSRVELAANDPGSKQPFHAAEGLALQKAATLIERSTETARRLAARALSDAVGELKTDGHEVVACGLLSASGRPLPGLEQVLASHALIHAAEGELFREAIVEASRTCGLPVTAIKERELLDRGAVELHLAPAALKARLDGFGRALGPPWRQDEKLATLVAWLALLASGRRRG
jgi:hypothetical protein